MAGGWKEGGLVSVWPFLVQYCWTVNFTVYNYIIASNCQGPVMVEIVVIYRNACMSGFHSLSKL